LLGGSVLLIDRRPGVAGVMLGLLVYKPQMAFVAGLALIVSRRWQALASTATTVVGLSLLSILFFGYEPWGQFFSSLSQKAKVLESGGVPWFKVTTTFCALRLAGASINVALAVHGAVALGAIVVALWAWVKKKSLASRGSTLIVATLLTTPLAHSYDLALLALPLSWLGWEGYTKGWLRWERPVLAACWLSPLIAPTLAQISNLQIAPMAMIALLILALRNDNRSLPEAAYS
jgi:alpha-1,2-mannosyltransferase